MRLRMLLVRVVSGRQWLGRFAAFVHIPQAATEISAFVQWMLPIQFAAVVLTVGADGVNYESVVEPFEADRFAIIHVDGNLLQVTRLDQRLQVFRPLAFRQPIAL